MSSGPRTSRAFSTSTCSSCSICRSSRLSSSRRSGCPSCAATGDDDDFAKLHKEAKSESVIEFLTLSPHNPNSILNCITNARENARHVREQISLEMWEEINRTYLSLKGFTAKKVARSGAYDFYNHIKNSSALFQGTTDGTMTHGEDWDFIQVGKFLERADMTTRIPRRA